MKKEEITYGLYVRNKKNGKKGDVMSAVDKRSWGSTVKILLRPQDCGWCRGAAWVEWNINDIEPAT